MPTNKLTIAPVTLDSISNITSVEKPQLQPSDPSCVIKTATAEISLFNNVDERIIQTIMKELNSR